MRTKGFWVLTAVCAALALTSCGRKNEAPTAPEAGPLAPAAPTGFMHETGFDAQGYYLPTAATKFGDLRLARIAVGAQSDFETFETGVREGVFGPIWFEFDDGQDAPATTVRVVPTAYVLGPGQISFRGNDPKLGDIVFLGAFDTSALAEARAAASSEEKPVLMGALQVGAEKIDQVVFRYWAGD